MTTSRTITRLGFAALACAPLSVALGEGSELPDGSVTITSLPFFDTGDTTDNLDDYDAVCPWASDSPDVFYTYTPTEGVAALEIDLCDSGYDTKIYVLDASFTLIACDDDGCPDGGGGAYRSLLPCVPVHTGETIHIAIDGWSGDAGSYDLSVTACDPEFVCDFDELERHPCGPGAIIENEPCTAEGPDLTNRGCASPDGVPRFESVECGDTFCGQLSTGYLLGIDYQDYDWFELTTTAPAQVTMSAVGEGELLLRQADLATCPTGAPECRCWNGHDLDNHAVTDPCRIGSIDADLVPAGRSWWVVTTRSYILPCDDALAGDAYVVTWNCIEMTCCASGDADENGTVDFNDLVIALANWGPCAAPPCCALGDANGDDAIGFDDVVILLANWGPCSG